MNRSNLLLLIFLALALFLFVLVMAKTNTPQVGTTPTPKVSVSTVASASPSVAPTVAATATPASTTDVRVTQPTSGAKVSSPLVIKGEARGSWYFEAVFPVKLLDASGTQIASGTAQAKSDWMTTNFVPFEATLTFTKTANGTGTLVLQKDNPSGLPQNDKSVTIPVTF